MLARATSPDQVQWLLGAADHAGVRSFWGAHLPVAMSSDPYGYHAVRVDGVVVAGTEPEFEDSVVVARSCAELPALLAGLTSWAP